MAQKKRRGEGRSTVYNKITSNAKLALVNPENTSLERDFLEYLQSIDRSGGTISQYRANLHIFWVWNLEHNDNKPFVKLAKRDVIKFQNHMINVWKWSPKRIRTVKSTLSSLSTFIENVLDDEYIGYKPVVNKIAAPSNSAVRKKSVFTTEQLQGLLNDLTIEEEYMKACMLSLAMNSGRRKLELTRFKVSYFDKENLICDGALYKTPEKVQTKGRGSKGKMLDVYVMAHSFQWYLDLWMGWRERMGIDSGWLFPREVDGAWGNDPISAYTMNAWADEFSERLNKPFYWHSCRHYFTTMLLESDLPESIVQDMIGWDSPDMVRLYDDRTKDAEFEKYFGADGIRKTERKTLNDL